MARYSGLFIQFAFAYLTLLSHSGWSQERCGTVEYEKLLHSKGSWLDKEKKFETWMKDKIAAQRLKNLQTDRTEASTYTIPIVVHIIHNGEAVGTGLNISDAQVISQIQVINDDYKRLNADRTNTPSEFLPLAGSIDIQFVLAKQDPEGLPTTGITRTQGTKTSWSMADNYTFKALSYWPAENYLNIWVISLTGGLIGYAQLPVSSLQGLENSSQDRLTDGVAINYKDFGSGSSFNLDPLYNEGRTATHEIGHMLGLRHIWGDGNCATDYVDDTPPQTTSTSGCPSNPQASCGSAAQPHKMFQNYMDYSSDVCMNIFTLGQIDRMKIVLANSIRRNSWLTSPGATAPVSVANDAGIRRIVAPNTSACSNPVVPQIEVRNYGTNTVSSLKVQMSVNGNTFEAPTFAVNLSPLQTTILPFSNLNFGAGSNQQVAFQVLQTNGVADGNNANNAATVQVTVPATTSLPISEPFNSLPSNWQVVNPDGDVTWSNVTAPDANPTNRAMYMNFNSYQSEGASDWLVTPAFTLANPVTSQLKFDIAYSQYPGVSGDTLKVYALRGCNPDLSQAILLYHKAGTALATTTSSSSSFVPASEGQWRKSEVVSLNTLSTTLPWQLAFVARNGYGNNLYVDNAVVKEQLINDVEVIGIASPGLVHCVTAPPIQFIVKNLSTAPIISFQVQRTLNGGSAVTQTFNNITLNVGDQQSFTLDPVNLNQGANQLSITVINPNGFPDSTPSNNTLSFGSYLDQSADASPLRLTFDNPAEVPWIVASSGTAKTWVPVTTTRKQSIVYNAFSNTNLGEESWLASPVLDLTRYNKQSLFFEVSYGQNPPANERLSVLASDDCGLNYKLVLYDHAASDFSIRTSASAWSPATDTDWKQQYINLDTLAGKSNVRLAVIVTNAHGNNLYFDNLEIFAGDDSNPPVTTVPYQLYYSTHYTQSDVALTFNLQEKTDVRLQIYSIMGQIVADNLLPATLNQTYYFDLGQQAAGLYLFRLQIDSQVTTTKVYIGH